jgi:phosphoribosylglycinamide formyltransferase-1
MTLRHLLSAAEAGELDATVAVLISNNADSGAMAAAKEHDLPAVHISSRTHPTPDDEQREIADVLRRHEVEWVVLAGWVKLIRAPLLDAFPGRILNLHPALDPAFGGVGMYGSAVHQAVLDAGLKTTGTRIHLVSAEYDSGPTLASVEVPVLPDDDAAALSQRVKVAERGLLVGTLNLIAAGKIGD